MTVTMMTKNQCCVDTIDLKCTPIEYLTISNALLLMANNEAIHEDDRAIAKELSEVVPICKAVD